MSAESLLRKAALVAGTGLLFMTAFAVGAIFFVFEKLIVPGDAGATLNNIIAGEMQFRIGIACLLVVAVLDVVVAWALYVFLKPAGENLSLLAAWFRVVYSAILGVALFSYANVLRFLEGAHDMKEAGVDRLHADVMLSLAAFDDGWAIGLVFFGLHLVALGYLIVRSDYVPKVLGILLAIAGVAYVADGFARFLLLRNAIELAAFVGWTELVFMLWLLYKGIREPDRTSPRH